MHVNNIELLAFVTAFLMDKGLLSIFSAGCSKLVKMLITLEQHDILDQILHSYMFKHCPVIGMRNGDEALPSIILPD